MIFIVAVSSYDFLLNHFVIEVKLYLNLIVESVGLAFQKWKCNQYCSRPECSAIRSHT
jgi:hypothetical protein